MVSCGGMGVRIIGVMPARFLGRRAAGKTAAVILPMFIQPQLGLKDHNTFDLMARLKPAVTLQQARADLDVIYRAGAGLRLVKPPGYEQDFRSAHHIAIRDARRCGNL